MVMSTAQIEKAFEAWPQVEPTLHVPHNTANVSADNENPGNHPAD